MYGSICYFFFWHGLTPSNINLTISPMYLRRFHQMFASFFDMKCSIDCEEIDAFGQSIDQSISPKDNPKNRCFWEKLFRFQIQSPHLPNHIGFDVILLPSGHSKSPDSGPPNKISFLGGHHILLIWPNLLAKIKHANLAATLSL